MEKFALLKVQAESREEKMYFQPNHGWDQEKVLICRKETYTINR